MIEKQEDRSATPGHLTSQTISKEALFLSLSGEDQDFLLMLFEFCDTYGLCDYTEIEWLDTHREEGAVDQLRERIRQAVL